MKIFLLATALIELGAGLALMALPSLVVKLLLGTALDSPAGITIGRVTGAALAALGVACWVASEDVRSRAAKGLVAAMLLYNIAVVAVLANAGLGLGLNGLGLWPGGGAARGYDRQVHRLPPSWIKKPVGWPPPAVENSELAGDQGNLGCRI